MSEWNQAVEAMARAIHDAADNTFAIYEAMQCIRLAQATAALTALRETLVPVGWAYERRAFMPALSQREPEYPDLLWKGRVYILPEKPND